MKMDNFFTQKLRLLLFMVGLFFCLGISNSFAQTGPGGAKTADGTSSLRLWLKGEYLVPATDDVDVTQWTDKSGYNRHFVPTGSPKPFTRVSGPFTQRTVARINIGNEGAYLKNDNVGGDLKATTSWTIYTVSGIGSTIYHPNTTENSLISWGDFTTAAYTNRQLTFMTSPETNWTGVMKNGTENLGSNGQTIFGNATANHKVTSVYQDGATLKFRINGVDVSSQSMTMAPFGRDDMYLGAYYDPGLSLVTGNTLNTQHLLGEVIAFNGALTDLERIMVDNYLGAKYRIDIGGGNDYYTGHDLTHVLDLIAIGRTGSAKQSLSTTLGGADPLGDNGAFTLEEHNNTLDVGEYVMAAHNGAAHGVSGDVPPSVAFQRWNRTYYIDKTGGVDTKLTFDLSKAGAFAGSGGYVLLYRSTPSGIFTKVSTATPAIVGSGSTAKVTFIVPNSIFQDGYYTIGSVSAVNLPVILYSRVSGGNWTDPNTWTLEPDGVTVNNPSNYIPDADKGVVVLSGKTVEISNDFQSARFVTVDGVLDIVNPTPSNHIFAQISGLGRIKLTKGGFPAHTTTVDFTSAGRGTIEYYGLTGGTLTGLSTYNNVIFTGEGSQTWILGTGITLNGNLQIRANTTLNGNGQAIDLKGNWDNQGVFIAGSSNMTFSGTNPQFVQGNATVFGSITVNKGLFRNVTLQADMTARNDFDLVLGNMVLGKYNLTLENMGASAVSGNATAFIEQWGKEIAGQGKVHLKGTTASHFIQNLPLGNANVFAPMNISTLAAGGYSFMTVETVPYETTQPNGLKRKWKIGTSGISAVTDFRATFTYPATEIVGTPTHVINEMITEFLLFY